MCGIAGQCDFQGDLERQQAQTQLMVDTMACRGPDDEGLWTSRHAAVTAGWRSSMVPAGGSR
jgi:asparagine synthase (glutamine-hydrolysing)